MSTKIYGVLIHGAGWVSGQHAAAFRQNPASRVVAVSSRSLVSAKRRIAESKLDGATGYDDFESALRHPGVDLVVICTPQHVHCANVLAAVAARKHVLIEKPVGISLDELRRMRAAVRRAGVKTHVSFVLRFNPLFQTLKSLVADGAVGHVYSVEADYLSHNGDWWSGWKDTCTQRNGVSALLVAGCHAIDALRWFAASQPEAAADAVEVIAAAGGYRKNRTEAFDPHRNAWIANVPPMEYDGLEFALVRFANGVVGKVCVNFDCIMPYRFPLRVFGDRGTILDNRLWSHKFPGQKDWIELPATPPDSSDVTHHPFHAQADYFIRCLRSGVESHGNLDDAIKTHEIVFAAQRSERTRRAVRLPLLSSRDRLGRGRLP